VRKELISFIHYAIPPRFFFTVCDNNIFLSGRRTSVNTLPVMWDPRTFQPRDDLNSPAAKTVCRPFPMNEKHPEWPKSFPGTKRLAHVHRVACPEKLFENW